MIKSTQLNLHTYQYVLFVPIGTDRIFDSKIYPSVSPSFFSFLKKMFIIDIFDEFQMSRASDFQTLKKSACWQRSPEAAPSVAIINLP
jgi:hypothetical protein